MLCFWTVSNCRVEYGCSLGRERNFSRLTSDRRVSRTDYCTFHCTARYALRAFALYATEACGQFHNRFVFSCAPPPMSKCYKPRPGGTCSIRCGSWVAPPGHCLLL